MEATRKGNGNHPDVAANVAPVVDRVAASAHEAVDRAASAANAAAKVVGEKASAASKILGEKSEQLKGLQDKYFDSCRESVRANPLTALGLAIAAGVALSLLLNNRR